MPCPSCPLCSGAPKTRHFTSYKQATDHALLTLESQRTGLDRPHDAIWVRWSAVVSDKGNDGAVLRNDVRDLPLMGRSSVSPRPRNLGLRDWRSRRFAEVKAQPKIEVRRSCADR